jgi:hypothetical protein
VTPINTISYLDRYPILADILDEASLRFVRTNPSALKAPPVTVVCPACKEARQVDLASLVKGIRRNLLKDSTYRYRCMRCSKAGDSGVGTKSVLHLIDVEVTQAEFGGIPDNVKTGKVVISCERCGEPQRVRLSAVLHQARRHAANGRPDLYKCFRCGILRPDAVEKSVVARASQLKDGFVSGLERAMADRLTSIGIKFTPQHKTGPYFWDFILDDYGVVVDVNGEYWHSGPKVAAKDRGKLTFLERHRPDLRALVIQEVTFLNPSMVDKAVLRFLGLETVPEQTDFSLSNVFVRRVEPVTSKSRHVQFLNSFHYAMDGRHGKLVFEAVLGDRVIAVCKFSSVTRREVATSMGLKCHQVLELDRFCIHPNFQKKNFGSWLISRCAKSAFEAFPGVSSLVSFADETFGHSGTIYRAANWIESGRTRPSYHYMNDLGVPINKKRVYDIASKLKMKEAEYVAKHDLVRYQEKPKVKFVLGRPR